MKILKLGGILVALIAAIVLALNWEILFPSDDMEEKWGDEDQLDITKECEKIRQAWAAKDGWSRDLYIMEREDIDQSKNIGLFSRQGYETVNNTLVEEAANKASDGYVAALKASPFNEKVLLQQVEGIRFLKDKEHLAGNQRVTRVEQLHKFYTSVKAFVGSSHTLTPHFDTSTTDWKSFNSLQDGVLSTARNYRSNPLFKEMQTVPGFVDGLDENKLRTLTNNQRERFHKELSQQIINFFESEEKTPERKQLLSQIYKNFSYQTNGNYLDTLADYLVNYGN